jgi:putative DNA primase/helicase
MPSQKLVQDFEANLSGGWINIRGPGHSSKDRSLGIMFDPNASDGFRISSLAGDDPIACRKHINALLKGSDLDLPGLAEQHSLSNEATAERIPRSMAIWSQGIPINGTLVEKYLTTRGCLPTADDSVADALRFHPFCPFGAYRFPTMLALMTDVVSGEPTGVHRTALIGDGSGKRIMPDGMPAKMMLGRAKGAAVILGRSDPRMGIAEGIETAFSAQKIFEMPVWACLSAGGIAGFPILKCLEHLTIFADHDKAGIKAAIACARHYQKNGIKVEVRHPTRSGDDWNAYLLREAA